MKRQLTIILCLCLNSGAVIAEELRMAMGLHIPPYVIREEEKGIEFDILKETLALQGHIMKPIFVPLARTLHLLKTGEVDGSMSTGLEGLPGCYTDPHITYWNYAISLKKADLRIQSIQDLQNLRVMSFQNARHYLGDAFKKMAETNSGYSEIANQSLQNKTLLRGRTDVVVADRYIFQWFMKADTVKAAADTTQEIVFHNLFDPSPFSAVFLDNHICFAFNQGLAELRRSGRYQAIIDSYGVKDISGAH